jgi:tRNA pseudouridine55 synthase
MDGFINLHKPLGMTSHDCVAKLRRLLKIKKIGHGGTLDPDASGVLPIAINKATRLLQFLPEDKTYQAKIRFGLTTTTDDLQGEIITQNSCERLSLEEITALLPQFIGKIAQIPPHYSAISVQGKRLYDLARSGQFIDVPARNVEIYKIDVLNWQRGDFPELDLMISCGSGTYIRAIARDLGKLLGVGGTLAGLIRTQSCGMLLDDSVNFEQIATEITGELKSIINPQIGLKHLGVINLNAINQQKWHYGQKILLEEESALGYTQVQDEQSQFLGIGEVIENDEQQKILHPKVVF